MPRPSEVYLNGREIRETKSVEPYNYVTLIWHYTDDAGRARMLGAGSTISEETARAELIRKFNELYPPTVPDAVPTSA